MHKADVEANGTVDGFDDLAHCGFSAARRDAKATRLPAARGDEPGAHQRLQHFGEKTLRRFGGLSELGQREPGIAFREGQLNHDANSVVGAAC